MDGQDVFSAAAFRYAVMPLDPSAEGPFTERAPVV
jgi:hypothetical protein